MREEPGSSLTLLTDSTYQLGDHVRESTHPRVRREGPRLSIAFRETRNYVAPNSASRGFSHWLLGTRLQVPHPKE